MCVELLGLAGEIAEKAFERIAPTTTMKALSKRIKNEDMAFNLHLTGYLYTPLVLAVCWTLHRQQYVITFGAILCMIGFMVWCTKMVKSEKQFQYEKKNEV